ncbi:epithelial sodium channel subunit alpha-like [Tachypleus tridentatus]|uniref:epithelial sodium channel subunit alpha-like n=1 Tax=Tachypleus tridentatus TaxID=6853 RepID=UPI003FD06FC1
MTIRVKPLDRIKEPALRFRTQRELYCNVVQAIKVSYSLSCVVACTYYMYLVLNNFFTYPTVLKISINTDRELVFPAVTLCNLNRIAYSSLQSLCRPGNVSTSLLTLCESITAGREDASSVFGPPQFSVFTPRIAFAKCSEVSNSTSTDADNLRNIEIVNVMSSLNQSLRHQLGHQVENFITSCIFMGKKCLHSNFTTTINILYGNCYTFNSFVDHPHEETPFKAIGGSLAGLHVELNLENWERITEYSEARGARVVIHSPYITPNIANDGFDIMPGTLTSVGVDQESEIVKFQSVLRT